MFWTGLVDRIKAGDSSADEELYRAFERGIRFLLRRYGDSRYVDDQLQNVLMSVIEAIKCDQLGGPECLPSFIRTLVQRTRESIARKTLRVGKSRFGIDPSGTLRCTRHTPEELLREKKQVALMREILAAMPARDQEALIRYYARGHDPKKICAEMKLTHTQFRLLTSGAKQLFAEAIRRKLEENR
jgi:DNA-directed RNA polymerase specialized sigma24 family protein